MYKAHGSEGFGGVHTENPVGTLCFIPRAPMYKAQGSEGVLGPCMLKTHSDPYALDIRQMFEWGFGGVHAQNPLGPSPYV